MKLKASEVNHLRRLLGYVRCEIGQSPDELVATVRRILPVVGDPSDEGKQRLVEAHRKAANVPAYIRAALKALEKAILTEKGSTFASSAGIDQDTHRGITHDGESGTPA